MSTPRIMLLLVAGEVLLSVLKSLLYPLAPEGKEMLDLLYVSLSAVICLLMLVFPFVSLYKSVFLDASEEELKEKDADMFTTIFIGNSMSRVVNGRLVTPRGYRKNG